MKVQGIQQHSYYHLPSNSNNKSNSPMFEALTLRKGILASANKNNASMFMKFGAMFTASAVVIKELFFNKVLDVITVNQIKQNAISFGESLAENVYQNGGKVVSQEIEQLVLTHLGDGLRKNVQVVTNEEGFCDFAEKNMKLERDYAKHVYETAGGLVAQGYTGDLIFLLKLEDREPDVAVNIATHEFEHLLYRTSGLLGKLIKKTLSNQPESEEADKSMNFSGEKENRKFFDLQNYIAGVLFAKGTKFTPFEYVEQDPTVEGIIELSPKLSSKEDLDDMLESYVRRKLISPKFDSFNLAELQGFEMILKDEARAYDAGGKAQRYYNKLAGNKVGNSTIAEMMSVVYNHMADKINKYKELCLMSLMKKSIGLKPTNYHEDSEDESV